MAKNDRFVVKHVHGEGWAVKKTNAGRASSVHETQREAEGNRSQSWRGGGQDLARRNTQRFGYYAAAMTRTHRATAATEKLLLRLFRRFTVCHRLANGGIQLFHPRFLR